MHSYQTFYAVVPEKTKKEDFQLACHFTNMVDVLKMKAIGGRFCVAPIFQLQLPDKLIMLVQMELPSTSKFMFEEARDGKAFGIIARMVSSIVERIFVNSRTSQTYDRAYKILKTCKYCHGCPDLTRFACAR